MLLNFPDSEFAAPEWRRIGLALILIAAITVLTVAVQQRTAQILENKGESETHRAVVQALDRIENQFRDLQNDMIDEARTLSRRAIIIRSLRQYQDGDRVGADEVVRVMAAYTPRKEGAIEIYSQEPRIIGWSGATMPLDNAPSEPEFLRSLQVKIARDGSDHAAVAVWWPVRDGASVLGVIRVIKVIERRVQVRNEFLSAYSMEDEWTRLTGLRIDVTYVDDVGTSLDETSNRRLLRGLDGKPLLFVSVSPPTLSRLITIHNNRYLDVIFLWITLGCLVVLYASKRWCLAVAPEESSVRRPLYRFLVFAILMVIVRFLFLEMDVPGRWQPGKAPLSPLFDPRQLASDFGWGIMRSTGDLLVTASALVVLAMVFVRATEPVRSKVQNLFRVSADSATEPGRGVTVRLGLAIVAHGIITLGLVMVLSNVARRTVLDSTLDFFERSGLLPDSIVMVVFMALLLWTFGVVFISSRSLWVCLEFAGLVPTYLDIRRKTAVRVLMAATAAMAILYVLVDLQDQIEWILALVFIATAWLVALYSPLRSDRVSDWLHLRSVIPSVVLVSMLLYPVLENGMNAERRLMMESAAESFQEDVNSRILFAIGQVLDRADEVIIGSDSQQGLAPNTAFYDSVARVLTHGELLAALGSHDVSVTIFDSVGTPLGRYVESGQPRTRNLSDRADVDAFELVYAMYMEGDGPHRLIEKMTGRQGQNQFPFKGFVPIYNNGVRVGWLMIRARPEEYSPSGQQAFPSVLTPAGFYGNRSSDISVAEFRDGLLSRSYGQTFGKSRLDVEIDSELNVAQVLWRVESMRDQDYLTLYVRPDITLDSGGESDAFLGSRIRTIAVRRPAVGIFDHLYYLLRITMVGLFLGLPVYLIGIWWRISRGLLPARRVRFRDKVLNAFFVAGIITVTATGWLGLRVVTGENDRAVESWLRQHLERVEATLLIDALSEELPYSVLERSDLDSLSARVGLDLNVYSGAELISSSRPQLVRERLIGARLPVEAYEALFLDGFRYVSVDQTLGEFDYTAGYRAFLDESGVPRYVISLPTLPEQERMEEERARTVAYLFGALLVLVFVVMVTAALLANALARPIAGPRAGLRSVTEGRFERIGPTGSRDEIADLVDTFNEMQSQLEESRYLLAKQERQLAWQEMARQVAHEIRNPLTPMKLAVQHLQRAFGRYVETRKKSASDGTEDFTARFKKTTATLVEQIDALANIAEEFSSFGRFPLQARRNVDLNEVVTAAVQLMRNESRVKIEVHLADYTLIIVADEESIRRLLINLLKNALQAIDDERTGLIIVETELETNPQSEKTAVVRVIDDGSGIPEHLWNRIFVPSFSTKTSGTGLGLAIARKTIEDHDGEIGFDTRQGEGTTFWIRLACSVSDEA